MVSKAISLLRFPLMVGIVFVHNNFSGLGGLSPAAAHCAVGLEQFFGKSLAAFCVPMFFLISGFLYFYRADFTLSSYRKKTLSRVRTILIPYLIWNLLCFFLFMAMGKASFADIGAALWSFRDGMPACFQMWFLRDLMVLVLIAPVVYVVMRFGAWWAAGALGLLWLATGWGVGLCFFSFGACLSIHKTGVCDWLLAFCRVLWLSCPVLLGLDVFACWGWDGAEVVHRVFIVVSILAVAAFAVWAVQRGAGRRVIGMQRYAFLLFAAHEPFSSLLRKAMVAVPAFAQNEAVFALGYFLVPLVVIAVVVAAFRVADRLCPKWLSVLVGARTA